MQYVKYRVKIPSDLLKLTEMKVKFSSTTYTYSAAARQQLNTML